MGVHFQWKLPGWWRRACVLYLAFSWCAGLLSGVFLASSAGSTSFPMMRAAVESRVSIVSLLVAGFLPFLFSAFAVSISQPMLLLPICFFKAFTFAFCAALVTAAFGSAGTLLRLLLLFSDSCTLPVLCWFCLRHIRGDELPVVKDLAISTVCIMGIAIVDYWLISPFWVKIIEN